MGERIVASPAATAAGSRLAQQLESVQLASFEAVREQVLQLYRKPAPVGFSRDLLARLVAHRLQEKRLGKLDGDVANNLDHLARGQESRRRLKSGTMLVREHNGIMHEVVIVPGGYLWNEKTFRSLSTIAKRITGTSWNGPRFFGLRQKAVEGTQHA